MSLTKTTVATNNISTLSDLPNLTDGLTAEQLKAKYDKYGVDTNTYINSVLTAELDENFATKAELAGIALGAIPDGSITVAKLAFDPTEQPELDAHIVDYVKHPAYGASGGSLNAYTFDEMVATAYVDGMGVYLDNVIAANTATSTLNWSSLGAKLILDSKGAVLTAGKMPLNCIIGLRYNASANAGVGAFQLLGEGSDVLTGDFVAGDLLLGKTGYNTDSLTKITGTLTLTGNTLVGDTLSGKTFYKDDAKTKLTGTMPNRGAVTITPSQSAQSIAVGYHNGSGSVSAVSFDASKVLTGTTIAGKVGTMPSKVGSAEIITVSTVDQAIPQGYYGGVAADGKIKGEPNLVASNIKKDVTIGNITGALVDGTNMKNYKTGTTTASGTTLTVTGLTFQPSVIIIHYSVGDVRYMQTYDLSDRSQTSTGYKLESVVPFVDNAASTGYTSAGTANPCTPNASGFTFIIPGVATGASCTWKAFE